MLTEVKYRTFDELLDSVKIDLKSFDLEGHFDPQQFIKTAILVNKNLGIKVNTTKSKVLDLYKGKVRLPEDMSVINFVLVCNPGFSSDDHGTSISTHASTGHYEGMLEGVLLAQKLLDINHVNQETILTDISPGSNIITHSLVTQNVVIQAYAPDGTILSFEVSTPSLDQVVIKSEYEGVLTNVKIILLGAKGSTSTSTSDVYTDASGEVVVSYIKNNQLYSTRNVYKIQMEKHKGLSSDCFNMHCQSSYKGSLKDGFLLTNFDEGNIFINYQSLMEDDQGNLLVMDHPFVNEYYEYAIKQRFFENLYLSGEQVQNMLSLMETRLRAARNNALSFINTPDFAELKKIWELNRRAQYSNYYMMFES